jgi:predicted nuclease of restriction endonuclease-like (RecB) superfamily
MLFHRIALSSDKNEVLRLAREGQVIEKPEDILRDPYVFEFTGLPQMPVYNEGDLEEALVNNLSQFFLELGKGFTYVGRQQKLVIAGRIYKVDLVFYHRILKCFVLVDLKQGEVQHEDIGQMNFYLNYFREEMNTEGDTEPIGIILGAYKDKLVMQYALQNITNQVEIGLDIFDNYNEHITQEIKTANKNVEYTYTCTCIDDDDDYYDQDDNDSDDNEPANSRSL